MDRLILADCSTSRSPKWDGPHPKGWRPFEEACEEDFGDELELELSGEEPSDARRDDDVVDKSCWRPSRLWRFSALLVGVSGLTAVLVGRGWLSSRQSLLRPLTRSASQLPLSQKWLPERPDQVLSFKKWMKEWHVVPGKLTPVIYHTYSHHPYFLEESKRRTEFIQWQLAHNCPKQIVGYDIEPMSPAPSVDAYALDTLKNVSSAGHCQQSCTDHADCTAWTYAQQGIFAKNCWRRKIPGGVHYVESKDVTSGQPCDRQARPYYWPQTNYDLYNLPVPPLEGEQAEPMHCVGPLEREVCSSDMAMSLWHMPWPLSVLRHAPDLRCCAPAEIGDAQSVCPRGYSTVRTGEECGGYPAGDVGCCPYDDVRGEKTATMHCLMLFQPYSQEQELVLMQYEMGIGIFDCDSWSLYSSQVIELAPGVVSRRISSNMMCELGGQFITALNLGIFLALYRQILLDRDFMRADWIVKVDPDTAWMPSRLQHYMREHSWGIGGDGIYFNNCGDGLHGPIEVFSKKAFRALGLAAKQCSSSFDRKECSDDCDGVYEQTDYCNGNCVDWWGEDIWSDQCLRRFTKAKRVMVKTLLQEDHCKPHIPNWRSCTDPHTVAFHPFKDPWEFKQCSLAMGALLA